MAVLVNRTLFFSFMIFIGLSEIVFAEGASKSILPLEFSTYQDSHLSVWDQLAEESLESR